MRVLHIITGLGVGGAECMLDRLLGELDPALVSSHVIALKEGGPVEAQIAARGVPVEVLGLNTPLPRTLLPLRLAQRIHDIAPDLVQTWMYHSDLIGGAAAVLARPFGPRIPVVWGIRQSVVNPLLLKPATWRVIRACAVLSRIVPRAIVVNAYASFASHAALGYATDKFVLIPNGFDSALFKPDPQARSALRQQLGVSPDTILVGLAGRLDPHKDYPGFLAAAQAIGAQHPNIAFAACGEGVESANPKMARLLAQLPLTPARPSGPYLHLLGRRSDMPGFWAAMDIAVSTSVGEGFSNSVGEAMACGLPCVVTNVGDSAVLIGDAGRVTPPGEPEALQEAILSLANMPRETRQALGQQARIRIQTRYSLAAASHAFLGLWQGVLKNEADAGVIGKQA